MILKDIILCIDDNVSLMVLDKQGNQVEIITTDESYEREVISFAPTDSNSLEVLIK